jgi:cysteine-rich repeat protein
MCTAPGDCTSGVCTGGVCQAETCMDGVKNGPETDIDCGGGTCSACAPGQTCMVGSDCTSTLCTGGVCTMLACGDGVVLGAELCDDGNMLAGDGCDATCATEFGYTCMGAPSVCSSTCGDGLRAGNEPCDDGNGTGGDGCSGTCFVEAGYFCTGNQPSVCAPVCGDGLKTGVEQCDDSNQTNGDCCSSSCQFESDCETEPNNTVATANVLSLVGTTGHMNAMIKPLADQDYFSFTLTQISDVKIATFDGSGVTCTGAGSDHDTQIYLFAPNGTTQLATDDDGGISPCSLINPTVTPAVQHLAPATYYVRVIRYSNSALINLYRLDVTLTAVCGNNITEGSEQCDGGPTCAPDCKLIAVCGDNLLSAGEQCDDGNTTSGDGCSSTCLNEITAEVESNNTCATASGPISLPTTVNAYALAGGGITPAADNDWFTFSLPMTADLKFETFDSTGPGSCSPLTVDTKIQVFAADCVTAVSPIDDQTGINSCSKLDPTTEPSVRQLPPGNYKVKVFPFSAVNTFNYTLQVQVKSSCGNNSKEGFEGCDDGNQMSGDGCSSKCVVEPGYICNGSPSVCMLTCGNGVIDGADQCDDSNPTSGDGCSSTCKVEPGYTCTGTPSVCSFTCGNGTMSGNEQCDDSNPTSGDGCSSTCQIEPGYTCTGTPSVCSFTCGNAMLTGNEQCEDGNMVNGDGCSSTCQVEPFYQCKTSPLPGVCTPQEINCSDGIDNDGDSLTDGMDPDCTLPAYFPACAAGQSLIVYNSVDVPRAIPDSTPAGITASVTAMLGGVTQKVAMVYNITHTYDNDVDIFLTPPGAPALDVCTDNGGSDNDFTNTVLDSTCGTVVTAGVAPFAGCYKPETAFTSLNGGSPNGTWTMKVVDDLGGDTGTLNSWKLVVCTTP